MSKRTACVSDDHPSLSGHFPGHPLVPGVVILQRVIAALEDQDSDCRMVEVSRVKFLKPLFPNQTFEIAIQQISTERVEFACQCGGIVIACGRLIITTTAALKACAQDRQRTRRIR
ncbi:MAG: hypothetical protein IPK66_08115 [Rhodospirillales bacterium]|nr:hypothetical protein [Rhodospirillales bacterium]